MQYFIRAKQASTSSKRFTFSMRWAGISFPTWPDFCFAPLAYLVKFIGKLGFSQVYLLFIKLGSRVVALVLNVEAELAHFLHLCEQVLLLVLGDPLPVLKQRLRYLLHACNVLVECKEATDLGQGCIILVS